MATRVSIDLNVRVRGRQTYAGYEDADGPLVVGENVEVYEAESGLVGQGRVVEVDEEKRLVFLAVDWGTLRFTDEALDQMDPADRYRPGLVRDAVAEREWCSRNGW
jgi:hypothetical protein